MTAEQLSIRYRALTPLYTGDRNMKVDRLHETGFHGSIRWWLEALIRGVGGLALDPVQQAGNFDIKKYKDDYGSLGPDAFRHTDRLRACGLDDASQVYGATGWRRRFRLELDHSRQFDRSNWDTISLPDRSYTATDRNGRSVTKTPTWWLKDKPFLDEFDLTLRSLDSGFPLGIVGGLLSFLEEWAGVGAKNQMGMGVIRRVEGDEPSRQTLYDWLSSLSSVTPAITTSQTRDMAKLPALDNMFLAHLHVTDDTKETTFRLKTDLRRKFTDDKVRHFVMGTIKDWGVADDGRLAAKVKISLPYKIGDDERYSMRIWGWLPHQNPAYTTTWTRDKVLQTIYGELMAMDANLLWREMNSTRDQSGTKQTDPLAFLKELLALS
ncbi:MAG: type III-B CRISPR module RAMP protein Cmr1 [Candidatus Promineofilum sp.]|nr:type III-B CRISPR module RAMP protein Cmr1 [Promineifilum sp.]